MKKKRYLLGLIIILLLIIPPFLAPVIHNGKTPQSAIRADLAVRGHPYQSFLAWIKPNGSDKGYGERFNVTWHDFDSETGMTAFIFYVKKNDQGYRVVSAGTGP
jgi:hypothetical protein